MPRMIINGVQCDAASGKTLDVLSPVNAKVLTTIPRGDKADIDAAVKAARAAVEGAWQSVNAVECGRLLMKLSQAVLDNFEELADLESRDTGKPVATAENDIRVMARYFEFYAGGADKVHGQIIPYLNDYTVQVLREPLGVTAHIIPWNYPAQMFGRSVAPALAMGNACVVKPAEDACLSVLRVAELAQELGFPPGALNVVTGLGEEAGAALAAHPDINFVTFTGSNEVGTLVQQAAARHAVKCVLELGGKSAHIVFDDVNMQLAVPAIVKSILQNAGQTCTAGSRLLVQRGVYDRFMQTLADAFSKTRAGEPHSHPDCGPLINASQHARVNRYLDMGRREGLQVLAEGTIDSDVPEEGFYVRPTLFAATSHDSVLLQEEIFGPVLVAVPFDTEDDAIRLANDTRYGLLGAIWTENGGVQQRVAKGIKCGQVFINGFGAGGGVELPFGGMKGSGHGREKGFVAMEEMSTTKTVVQFHGRDN